MEEWELTVRAKEATMKFEASIEGIEVGNFKLESLGAFLKLKDSNGEVGRVNSL